MKIFISYRREDSQIATTSIYRELTREIKAENIFFDIDSIPVGENFKTFIEKAMTKCGLMLVIIGKRWTNSRNRDGNRRLDDPADLVRLEIESGLSYGLRVVPVLVDGATMPSASELPASLHQLVSFNAAQVEWDRDFNSHIQRLLRDIRTIRTSPPNAVEALSSPIQSDSLPARQSGMLNWPNGDRYVGEYLDGKMHGRGVYQHATGSLYEGDFSHGKMHGHGTYYYAEGHRYEGEFVQDKQHGSGVTHYLNGDRHEGEYVGGKMHGYGRYDSVDGHHYEGEYVDGKMHGQGSYTFDDGRSYQGEWFADKKHGKGTTYFTNGDRFEGEYRDNQPNGNGIYYFAEGVRIEGEYIAGKIQGQGVFFDTDGRIMAEDDVPRKQF